MGFGLELLEPLSFETGLQEIDPPDQMDDVLADDVIRCRGVQVGHDAGHVFVEGGEKTILELCAILVLQPLLDLDALIQPEAGNPPVLGSGLPPSGWPDETIHDVQVGQGLSL